MYIIAEAGINHNGDLDTALKLCAAAKAAGAACVKFQMYTMDNLFLPDRLAERYKALMPVLARCELDGSSYMKIRDYCREIKMDWAATPEDMAGVEWLLENHAAFIKVGSRQALNFNYLDQLGTPTIKVLMSMGLSSERERNAALCLVPSARLLLCVSKYPAEAKEYLGGCGLLADKSHAGVSDHTVGLGVPVAAAGAKMNYLEKHFTLDRAQIGPDHAFSLDPATFKIMVDAIRDIT